jgi:hypothetical protein
MTDPTVTEVVDRDGRHHFAATASKFVQDGLAAGSLRRADELKAEEVPADAPQVPGDGDGDDTPAVDDRRSDGTGDDTSAARGRRAGKA